MGVLFGGFLVRIKLSHNCHHTNQLVITVHTFICLHLRHIINDTCDRFANCFKSLITIPTWMCLVFITMLLISWTKLHKTFFTVYCICSRFWYLCYAKTYFFAETVQSNIEREGQLCIKHECNSRKFRNRKIEIEVLFKYSVIFLEWLNEKSLTQIEVQAAYLILCCRAEKIKTCKILRSSGHKTSSQ
jgi:uncharacterized membrane protein YcaP (DUF421 family)